VEILKGLFRLYKIVVIPAEAGIQKI
jgi:hypothetical protein